MTVNVKLIKLVSGEELLGNLITKDTTEVVMEDLVRIHLIPPTPQNPKPSVAFSAFLPYVIDKEFTFKTKDILISCDPDPNLKEQWKLIFGKGTSLWVPGQGGLAATQAAVERDPLAAIRASKPVADIN